jgi:hypothetical protein
MLKNLLALGLEIDILLNDEGKVVAEFSDESGFEILHYTLYHAI